MNFLIFLGADFDYPVYGIYQYLPRYLQSFGHVCCVEYPQFIKLLKILSGKLPFVERKTSSLTIIHSFGILPWGRRFSFINYINHFILYFLTRKPTTHNPQPTTVISLTPEIALLKRMLPENITYYIIDDYAAVPIWINGLRQLARLEKDTLAISQTVIAASQPLYEKYKNHHQNVVLFENPSNTEPFYSYKQKNDVPSDMMNIPKPIAGCIGSLYSWRIDRELLLRLAESLPDVSFVFIGDMKKQDRQYFNEVFKKANCFYLGLKNYNALPHYVSQFDVCMIPYRVNDYSNACFPTKLFEYLAMEKPVVTTALSSLRHFAGENLIYWEKHKETFKKLLVKALAEKNQSLLRKKRRQLAIENSWNQRIHTFMQYISP